MKKQKLQRLWELDFIRGIAIILMLIYHFIYILGFFGYEKLNFRTGFWYYEGRLAAFLFIALAGTAGVLINKRYKGIKAFEKNLKRFVRLLIFALIVTIGSWFFNPSKTIVFGILHFLSACILLTIPLLRFKWLNLGLAFAAALIGKYTFALTAKSYLWLPLGIRPDSFGSFDYHPIFPWITFFLIGIFLGHFLYQTPEAIIKRGPNRIEKSLALTGKYSLWIYMIHVPVIAGGLFLIWRY